MKTNVINIDKVIWDPKIYPRAKSSAETIKRYSDAMMAGDVFPPMTLEEGTNVLIDGKHRLEAYKEAGIQEIPVEFKKVPNGMTIKYFAATLSARHGDRLSNADLRILAEEEFEANDKLDPTAWGAKLGVSKSTVYRWVSHILERGKAGREAKAWRLSQLGWTQQEIGERLGVGWNTVLDDCKNSHLGKITETLGPHWNEKGIAEVASRLSLPLTDAWAAAMVGMSDQERLERLGIKIQPYDVWHFPGCHDLIGDKHPGRIPGELVCHTLYFWTKPGDLVVDPMAGSGTVLDACLLMGRKARGFEIDLHHERIDIEQHDLSDGWPEIVSKAKLIFWDPPYFDKKGEEYVSGSISEFDPNNYLAWLSERFLELHEVASPGSKLAFLMSDWDPENAKNHSNHPGIFLWDYVGKLNEAGWKVFKQVQVPLPTQQIHPDIVNKFREKRRMARLGRYLLGAEK